MINYGVIDIRKYYPIFSNSDDFGNGRSKVCKDFSKDLKNLVSSIPKKPGVYIWLNNKSKEIIYVGKALSDKNGFLQRRIRDELYEERLFFYLDTYDYNYAIELFSCYKKCGVFSEKSLRHFERSSRKKSTTHIIWFSSDSADDTELQNLSFLEGRLVKHLNPLANQTSPQSGDNIQLNKLNQWFDEIINLFGRSQTLITDISETFEESITSEDKRPDVVLLFSNIRKELPNLTKLLEDYSDDRGYEDVIYRFYHQSFKVYRIQNQTLKIVENLKNLLPDRQLNKMFLLIVDKGTGMEFDNEVNKDWLEVTQPMLEAFFHARYFLEMAVKYGSELKYPPSLLPTGWVALLHLYNLR